MAQTSDPVRIVFHGINAGAFADGFKELLQRPAEVVVVPDELANDSQRAAYAAADVIVSFLFNRTLPRPEHLVLLQIPGAGFDAIAFHDLPRSAVVCNCFGHEEAIAEYVMGSLLLRQIPFVESDRLLRQGDWALRGGPATTIHGELFGRTIGILGFGHIGKEVARRAKAFGMAVHVANRSPVGLSSVVDRYFPLDELKAFLGSADFIVLTLPLSAGTRGLVGAEALAAMRASAVIVNVGRGPLIDERALYEALKGGTIAGAVIDTWYRYPSVSAPKTFPSEFPFHELPNVIMTPHMSGWTGGTIRRRQQVIAENIGRRLSGEPCLNVVHAPDGA